VSIPNTMLSRDLEMEGRRVGGERWNACGGSWVFMDHHSGTLLVTYVFAGLGDHDFGDHGSMPKVPTTTYIQLCESLGLHWAVRTDRVCCQALCLQI
jgi:hypothetical protein